MSKFMSFDDFLGKVEWEGGVLDALEYGLSYWSLDPKDPQVVVLRDVWSELEDAYEEVARLVRKVEGILYDE